MKHWGLPIPPPPTYTRCRTCAGPVIFGRCQICQPVTAADRALDELADREAENELTETNQQEIEK